MIGHSAPSASMILGALAAQEQGCADSMRTDTWFWRRMDESTALRRRAIQRCVWSGLRAKAKVSLAAE